MLVSGLPTEHFCCGARAGSECSNGNRENKVIIRKWIRRVHGICRLERSQEVEGSAESWPELDKWVENKRLYLHVRCEIADPHHTFKLRPLQQVHTVATTYLSTFSTNPEVTPPDPDQGQIPCFRWSCSPVQIVCPHAGLGCFHLYCCLSHSAQCC